MAPFEQLAFPHPEAHVVMATVSYEGRGNYTARVRVWDSAARVTVDDVSSSRLTLDEALQVLEAMHRQAWLGVD